MIKELKLKMDIKGKEFPGTDVIIKLLSKSYKELVRLIDIIVADEKDDDYLMKASFRLEETKKTINIYYGCKRREVTNIEWEE